MVTNPLYQKRNSMICRECNNKTYKPTQFTDKLGSCVDKYYRNKKPLPAAGHIE